MDTTSILLGMLFGAVGFGYVIYGRRQHAGVPLLVGVVLMVCPYVISNPYGLAAAGAVLAAIPWVYRG